MAIDDIMNVAFPLQSLTSQAAMNPQANMMGLASSPFAVGGGQGAAPLMGLASLVDQYGAMNQQQQPQANQFASETPGAPSQPGRIDQSSFRGQQMDPLSMLDVNIARRFGGR